MKKTLLSICTLALTAATMLATAAPSPLPESFASVSQAAPSQADTVKATSLAVHVIEMRANVGVLVAVPAQTAPEARQTVVSAPNGAFSTQPITAAVLQPERSCSES